MPQIQIPLNVIQNLKQKTDRIQIGVVGYSEASKEIIEYLEQDEQNKVTLFVSSLLEKQRADVDGRAADEIYKMEETEIYSSIDFWIFITPHKKPGFPPENTPEFFYSQEDDFEMITKNKEVMNTA